MRFWGPFCHLHFPFCQAELAVISGSEEPPLLLCDSLETSGAAMEDVNSVVVRCPHPAVGRSDVARGDGRRLDRGWG